MLEQECLMQQAKKDYRAVKAPGALRGRVLSAVAEARKRRSRTLRRAASAAACLAVVLSLGVYGLSPVPGLAGGGTLSGCFASVEAARAPQQSRDISPYAIASEALGETIEGCAALTAAHAETVTVSAGTLYALDPVSGYAYEAETPYAAAAGETLYWQCAQEEEHATLTLRAGVRTVTLTLFRTDGGWTLQKAS